MDTKNIEKQSNQCNLTYAITSCNRLFYLKSLLFSIQKTKNSNDQVIVVDNGSTENGLKEFLLEKKEEGLITDLVLRDSKDRDWINDEYIARNKIIELTKSDIIFFIQDDSQIITNANYVNSLVEAFRQSSYLSLDVTAVRSETIFMTVSDKFDMFNNEKLWQKSNIHYGTTGLFKTWVYKKYGDYPINWKLDKEKWGASEDYYDHLLKNLKLDSQLSAKSHIPLIASIWNDPRGGYAFIRGNKRYGHYIESTLSDHSYYEVLSDCTIVQLKEKKYPLSFSEVAHPIGWEYKKSESGDQYKYSQKLVMTEGPESDF